MSACFEPNWVVLQSSCHDALAQCSENSESSSNECSYDVITGNKHERGTCTCIVHASLQAQCVTQKCLPGMTRSNPSSSNGAFGIHATTQRCPKHHAFQT